MLAVADVIHAVSPDILLLNGFDYDLDGIALGAFADVLGDYPYRFALRPNTGVQTGLDMDGDGKTGSPSDAQGFGRFAGQGGMAILSRYPLDVDAVQDFSSLKWVDFPDAMLPVKGGKPFPSPQALAAQRLSSVGHWVVPVQLPQGVINLLAFHAGPPVFDGPEDRNGKRNHDEVRFWSVYLDGGLGTPPARGSFVILGDANQDPQDGEGLKDAIRGLLAHPLVQDPLPKSKGAVVAAREQGGANANHQTDPALDTVDWKDDPAPGNLRVDYVLPSKDLQVAGAGVYWPVDGDSGAASRHRLVWVDLVLDR